MLKRAVIAVAIIAPLATGLALGWPICASAGLFDKPCPGCGLTRATIAALQGDFDRAFHLHPLFPLITPMYVYLVVSVTYRCVTGSRTKPLTRKLDGAVSVLAGVTVVLLLGVWIARMFGAFGGPVPVQSWIDLIR